MAKAVHTQQQITLTTDLTFYVKKEQLTINAGEQKEIMLQNASLNSASLTKWELQLQLQGLNAANALALDDFYSNAITDQIAGTYVPFDQTLGVYVFEGCRPTSINKSSPEIVSGVPIYTEGCGITLRQENFTS